MADIGPEPRPLLIKRLQQRILEMKLQVSRHETRQMELEYEITKSAETIKTTTNAVAELEKQLEDLTNA